MERVHQVVGDMLRTQNLKEHSFDQIDPLGQILNEVAWVIHRSHHTINRASLGQSVLGRDMVFNIPYNHDWDEIIPNKQKIINKSKMAENTKRLKHDYAIDEKIRISCDNYLHKLEGPYLGPFG